MVNHSTKRESFQSLNTDNVDLAILQFFKNEGEPLTAKTVEKLTTYKMCTISGAISRLQDNKLLVITGSYRSDEPGARRENVYAPANDVDDKIVKINKRKATKAQKALVAKAKAAKGSPAKLAKLVKQVFANVFVTTKDIRTKLKTTALDARQVIEFLIEKDQLVQNGPGVYSFKIHQ